MRNQLGKDENTNRMQKIGRHAKFCPIFIWSLRVGGGGRGPEPRIGGGGAGPEARGAGGL